VPCPLREVLKVPRVFNFAKFNLISNEFPLISLKFIMTGGNTMINYVEDDRIDVLLKYILLAMLVIILLVFAKISIDERQATASFRAFGRVE